ncbi:TadE/TadG family type IV pilus assembly protein [Streptomyces sp. NBC_00083]|uniref:TadE/TadG family type IV pilus assembly protein n=1 Tax=Streptomyces sp. NBC_00083 TaxID=2975647 RepID=UPI00224CFE84|nr:TadE/TadG family type IV pilus assembly protein [Streptomyces sp. NBC_00083]MCX5385314.1 pilus assembly protein [Streptomyces sp. NBC_00083]
MNPGRGTAPVGRVRELLTRPSRRTRQRLARVPAGERDRGQTVIEFIGVVPLILLLLVALWQCALVGYAFVLAGNAADEGARAGAAAESDPGGACRTAAEGELPSSFDAVPACGDDGTGMYRATVTLKIPVLIPGVLNGFPVEGTAAHVKER